MMIFLKKYGFWILAGGLLLALLASNFYLKLRLQGKRLRCSRHLAERIVILLDDLAGDYILLDFWGSWCGPCRQANPTLVKIYREFARTTLPVDPAFTWFPWGGISQARWKQAIQQDRLRWPITPTDTDMFNGEIARLYGVKQIPTTYLIDPDRKIIGVNLPEDRLRKVLQGVS